MPKQSYVGLGGCHVPMSPAFFGKDKVQQQEKALSPLRVEVQATLGKDFQGSQKRETSKRLYASPIKEQKAAQGYILTELGAFCRHILDFDQSTHQR